MDSDNESYQSESEFYYHDTDFRCFRPFHSDFVENNKSVIYQPTGQSILGKNCALGLEYGPWACGTVFPIKIQTSWMANNIIYTIIAPISY